MLFYTTDCADDQEDEVSKLQQRSVSLVSSEVPGGPGSQIEYFTVSLTTLQNTFDCIFLYNVFILPRCNSVLNLVFKENF